MKRRKNPTGIEVRNVIDKYEQATRLDSVFAASERIGVLVALVADLSELSLHFEIMAQTVGWRNIPISLIDPLRSPSGV